MLRFSATISSSEIAMTFAARLDIYLLTTGAGLKAVEAYTTVVMMVNALRSIRQSFDNIVLGLFSRMAKARDPLGAMAHAYQQANARVIHLQWPVLAALLAYGDRLLAWLLPQSGDLQAPLALGAALAFITTPAALCVLWQIGQGRSWMMPLNQVVFVAVSAGLNLLLIPGLGVTGAVLAGSLAQLAGSVPAWTASISQAGWSLYDRDFWRPLLPALVWPAWLVLHAAGGGPWWDVLIAGLLLTVWLRPRTRCVAEHV
jgi:hypothetical protein